jgi:hypothetical protein
MNNLSGFWIEMPKFSNFELLAYTRCRASAHKLNEPRKYLEGAQFLKKKQPRRAQREEKSVLTKTFTFPLVHSGKVRLCVPPLWLKFFGFL